MVNTRTDTDLAAAIQNALQAMLPQIRERSAKSFVLDLDRPMLTSSETSTEFMQRFLRLAGFLEAAAGTEEEQAKNFQ
nr:zinc finger, CCHC-type, retrotransposon Gag domain protein [Tanacetum cinerariifolium]